MLTLETPTWATQYVINHITQWVDNHPRIEDKEIFIDFAKQLITAYEEYKNLITNV